MLYLGAYVCDYSSLDAGIAGVHVSLACAATCAFVTSELNGGRVDLAHVPGGNGIYSTIVLLYMLLFYYIATILLLYMPLLCMRMCPRTSSMCPRTTAVCVSSCCYCVCELRGGPVDSHACLVATLHMSSYSYCYYISSVLILLLYMCPHTTTLRRCRSPLLRVVSSWRGQVGAG